ncbi:MAG: hypothetical protein ACOCUR_00395 [Nanoarchaeota archaeon]
MKKAAIEMDKLVILVIGLVVLGVVIFGFSRMWQDGEETSGELMDYEDCGDGVFDPFREECVDEEESDIFVPLVPGFALSLKKLFDKRRRV